jgi:metal-sulfur cluster biosynthetic enzyme
MIDGVLAALGEVYDPELDESVVDLQFLDDVRLDGDAVEVVLRLPTFMCAPNFAYLMAHDAREAVLAVPGVRSVQVHLKDHMYSDEISRGVSCGESFSGTFGDQAQDDDLTELRALFRRKGFGMRQEQLVRFLQEVGLTADEIVALRVDTPLPKGAEPLAQRYLLRRGRLGISGEVLITDADGHAIAAHELDGYLAQTRRQRISMTFNALLCRGLLETRYELSTAREASP